MKFKDIISASILSNKIVTRRVPSIIFIAILTILYIFNSFDTQKIYREILKVEKEIKQLQVTATSVQAERISVTRELYIVDEIIKRKIDIKSFTTPPKILK
ncbi:MAG: FtsL-like putative cell division protein [Rikenellaceae bacterium]